MKIAIAGGCFTNQHNIPFHRLYHQTIKTKLEDTRIPVEIRTIRYERILKCPEKIMELEKDYSFDILLFHLRAEPLMRMTKLYYRYLNTQNKLRHSVNLPYLNILNPEKIDLLSLRPPQRPIDDHIKESSLYYLFRELNYLAGTLIGNKRFALNLVEKTVLQIYNFCLEKKISLLVIGPVSRPFSFFENRLSKHLNQTFEKLTDRKNIDYINLIKETCLENHAMFFKNGIHVSQSGHDEIADTIYRKLLLKIRT
jgi:hypothetical protein